jgi:hypothetical protein
MVNYHPTVFGSTASASSQQPDLSIPLQRCLDKLHPLIRTVNNALGSGRRENGEVDPTDRTCFQDPEVVKIFRRYFGEVGNAALYRVKG